MPQPSHFILAKEPYKIIYIKKNNKKIDISDAKTQVEEFKDEIYDKYKSKTFLYCSIKLDDNDLRKKLIIIELCFEVELKDYYENRFIQVNFYKGYPKRGSFLIRYDENINLCGLSLNDFLKISPNELFLYKTQDSFDLTFKDKRIDVKLKDEHYNLIKSKFTQEEINQINFSLKTIALR